SRLSITTLLLYHLHFFFHDPPPTDLYTLSLHDALPISSIRRFRLIMQNIRILLTIKLGVCRSEGLGAGSATGRSYLLRKNPAPGDRKSTRLNSSHVKISYAVFCLKKKKK